MGRDTFTREEMERANRLICWMAGYIGQMAPGRYDKCYLELNEHGILMAEAGISSADPSKRTSEAWASP